MNMSIRRLSLPLLALGLASLLGGCVGQGEYDRLYEVNASLTAQNKDLARQVEEERAAKALLQNGALSGDKTVAGLQKQLLAVTAQRDNALQSLRDMEKRLAGMDFGPVDATTDLALAQIASQFPDLIKYDQSRGMLRFASDLTFDSGSDKLRADAASAIDALGKVLTSSSASAYEVVIEGHTDSQRLSAGTAQRHRTNRHLSTHRAISVAEQLAGLGVASDRMLAAGWGEWRPLVPNTGNGNTPSNRRVEIFLAKGRGTGGETNTAPATIDRTTNVNDDIDITK
jgi:chemotaxis protein MotB